MKKLSIFLILIICLNNTYSFAVDKPTELENKIFKNWRCLICQGQSVYDSQSDFAESMKIVVRKNLKSGMSEKDIYQFMRNNYGEWVLYDPEINKGTYLLWGLPFLFFLIGGAIILRKLGVLKR